MTVASSFFFYEKIESNDFSILFWSLYSSQLILFVEIQFVKSDEGVKFITNPSQITFSLQFVKSNEGVASSITNPMLCQIKR